MKILVALIIGCFLMGDLVAQDPWRFRAEMERFDSLDRVDPFPQGEIVFTGSSSIRFWASLQEDFPDHQVLNRGFGGSHMSDLDYFWDKLILQHQPKKVFIYEGDNDIAADKPIAEILEDTDMLINKIKKHLPFTKVYLISPKPSISRWSYRAKYEQLNYQLGLKAMLDPTVVFVDVWTPMCDASGEVLQDVFISDDLHMNAKGYAIWREVIAPYVEE